MANAKNGYTLPVNLEKITSTSKKASPAHVGSLKHSIDFGCEEGTPIHAAKGGRVIYVKANSKRGGPHKKYWNEGNRIVLAHQNGEYTAYEHLRYKGSKVSLGQLVRTGQIIGYSGNTGFTYGPHLHFEVFRNFDEQTSEGETLQVSLKSLIYRYLRIA